MRASQDELVRVLAPACSTLGLSLFDVEFRSGTLQVTVDGPGELDLQTVTAAARAISAILDERNDIAPDGRYELEVTSPGLERRLRRAEHFVNALGTKIALRTVAGTAGDRRLEGELILADGDGVVVRDASGERRLAYREIERAHTVFDWRAALAAPRQAASNDENDAEANDSATTRERATTQ